MVIIPFNDDSTANTFIMHFVNHGSDTLVNFKRRHVRGIHAVLTTSINRVSVCARHGKIYSQEQKGTEHADSVAVATSLISSFALLRTLDVLGHLSPSTRSSTTLCRAPFHGNCLWSSCEPSAGCAPLGWSTTLDLSAPTVMMLREGLVKGSCTAAVAPGPSFVELPSSLR